MGVTKKEARKELNRLINTFRTEEEFSSWFCDMSSPEVGQWFEDSGSLLEKRHLKNFTQDLKSEHERFFASFSDSCSSKNTYSECLSHVVYDEFMDFVQYEILAEVYGQIKYYEQELTTLENIDVEKLLEEEYEEDRWFYAGVEICGKDSHPVQETNYLLQFQNPRSAINLFEHLAPVCPPEILANKLVNCLNIDQMLPAIVQAFINEEKNLVAKRIKSLKFSADSLNELLKYSDSRVGSAI